MKKRLAISFLFVFTMAMAAPVYANALSQDPQKTETCEKKKECDKTEKKAECCDKKKECDKTAEKKACCEKKAEEPKK